MNTPDFKFPDELVDKCLECGIVIAPGKEEADAVIKWMGCFNHIKGQKKRGFTYYMREDEKNVGVVASAVTHHGGISEEHPAIMFVAMIVKEKLMEKGIRAFSRALKNLTDYVIGELFKDKNGNVKNVSLTVIGHDSEGNDETIKLVSKIFEAYDAFNKYTDPRFPLISETALRNN